jgi:hypothetical protein
MDNGFRSFVEPDQRKVKNRLIGLVVAMALILPTAIALGIAYGGCVL